MHVVVTHPGRRVRQAGFSLIEAMVSILVLSFGVLALAGLQLRVLVDSVDASHKSVAVQLGHAMADRIRANPLPGAASASPYVKDWSAASDDEPNPSCASASASCSATQLAAFDVWSWKRGVAAALPGGVANIEARDTAGGLLFVHIAWDEPAVIHPIAAPDAWKCPRDKACQEVIVAVPEP